MVVYIFPLKNKKLTCPTGLISSIRVLLFYDRRSMLDVHELIGVFEGLLLLLLHSHAD
jgi:hypothetical protein